MENQNSIKSQNCFLCVAEVDAKNEGGMQCRVVGEKRTDTPLEMETNVCTDRKHKKKQLY